ncbi:MAG TPA: AMP-binding protein [Roseomonas sp.]
MTPDPGAATIAELLAAAPAAAPALRSLDGQAPLTHAALRDLMLRTQAGLNARGIGRGDRVAMVLPNGPGAAAAFLAVAASAAAAPLNPGYRREEYDFHLRDLAPAALLTIAGIAAPARAAAAALGVMVIEMVAEPAHGAGAFRLEGGRIGRARQPGFAAATDLALLLHTSGTTARPKRVPLTQANLVASARHVAAALALGPGDLGLGIMPLFHIHGLVAGLLAPLAAGGSVCCTPGFDALRFQRLLMAERPSWVTAVPTMYQAILMRAAPGGPAAPSLRFLRSSSAALPGPVLEALEARFGVPAIESYGMTEAAHQIASNRLDRPRRPGVAGWPAGPELVLLDEAGDAVPAGGLGEVAIRGPNVMRGYADNPAANARAFAGGWLRTGDQGRLGPDGALTLTGRLKELINRGGEKISPLELDAVLAAHPAVAQALCFALPHARLGEEVAAAVVLRGGHTLDEAALRRFAADRLADFKVPRRVIFLPEIPKGPTGKPMRLGLAAQLGLA